MADKHRDTLQRAARHLLQRPLTCAEQFPDVFADIRQHQQTLDRWFAQRLGYRLQVSSLTARLYKTTVVPHRPVLPAPVGSGRALSQRECTLLVLVLAAVAAGPRVISLRDLIEDVRSQASDASIAIGNEAADRRSLVIALKWMVAHGLLRELHEHIDRYEQDDSADAILEIEFDRISMLPLAALGRATSADELIDRSDRRATSRQWMRANLVENPVLYRTDLSEFEWSELRRRIGEEVALLDEMFALRVEARAEGIAAIDPSGQLSDRQFPAGGTIGHAALLTIDALMQQPQRQASLEQLHETFCGIVEQNRRHWSKARVEHPQSLLRDALQLLADMHLLQLDAERASLLPAAARYALQTTLAGSDSEATPAASAAADPQQTSLW